VNWEPINTFLQQPVRVLPPLYLPLDWPIGWFLLGAGILHAAIGVLAAIVAVRKGRRLSWWLPIGVILGTPALVMALRLPQE
jgi:hypothetical protein